MFQLDFGFSLNNRTGNNPKFCFDLRRSNVSILQENIKCSKESNQWNPFFVSHQRGRERGIKMNCCKFYNQIPYFV